MTPLCILVDFNIMPLQIIKFKSKLDLTVHQETVLNSVGISAYAPVFREQRSEMNAFQNIDNFDQVRRNS